MLGTILTDLAAKAHGRTVTVAGRALAVRCVPPAARMAVDSAFMTPAPNPYPPADARWEQAERAYQDGVRRASMHRMLAMAAWIVGDESCGPIPHHRAAEFPAWCAKAAAALEQGCPESVAVEIHEAAAAAERALVEGARAPGPP